MPFDPCKLMMLVCSKMGVVLRPLFQNWVHFSFIFHRVTVNHLGILPATHLVLLTVDTGTSMVMLSFSNECSRSNETCPGLSKSRSQSLFVVFQDLIERLAGGGDAPTTLAVTWTAHQVSDDGCGTRLIQGQHYLHLGPSTDKSVAPSSR